MPAEPTKRFRHRTCDACGGRHRYLDTGLQCYRRHRKRAMRAQGKPSPIQRRKRLRLTHDAQQRTSHSRANRETAVRQRHKTTGNRRLRRRRITELGVPHREPAPTSLRTTTYDPDMTDITVTLHLLPIEWATLAALSAILAMALLWWRTTPVIAVALFAVVLALMCTRNAYLRFKAVGQAGHQ
jgi:hypothetical protein